MTEQVLERASRRRETDRGPNAFQRMMQRFASLRPVAFVFSHTIHHTDRAAAAVLGGRTLSGVVAGLPNILVTTTGARTGAPRTVPLLGVPVDQGVAIVGTSFGSEHHPAWYYNLRQDPRAVVRRGRATEDVIARQVPPGHEYDEIMRRAGALYLGLPKYSRRISGREVPVFVLEPRVR